MKFNKSKTVIKRVLSTICCFAILQTTIGGWVWAEESGPTQQMQLFVESIITILKDESLLSDEKHEIRKNKILEEVDRRFNFNLMAQLSLGQLWNKIEGKQKDHFSTLFSELLKNTYIKRVEGYSDEKVSFGQEVIKNNLAQVLSVFERNNDRLAIVYKLRQEDGDQWLVYDVVIEGASIIKQYRRQFAQIIKQENFQGLMIRLEDKMKAIKASEESS